MCVRIASSTSATSYNNSRLVKVPETANMAASLPHILATRSSSLMVASSSSNTQSPREARKEASICASVCIVTVSPDRQYSLHKDPLLKSVWSRFNLATFSCPLTSADISARASYGAFNVDRGDSVLEGGVTLPLEAGYADGPAIMRSVNVMLRRAVLADRVWVIIFIIGRRCNRRLIC